jgi:polysaccharide export outer membrane protein
MRSLRHRLALALVLLALATGVATAQGSSSDYQVGPKDLLEIKVLEVPDLSVERRVSDNGALDLPLLGELPVAGLTAPEIRDRIEKALTSKYMNRANVSVVVKEFANKPVSVLGAVYKPGSLSISGRWTLINAITAAGGITSSAGRKVLVLRRADNDLTDALEIDVDDLFGGTTPFGNIPIQPGDVINIPPRKTLMVFCLGEVKTPGALQFDSDDRLTLLSVIAKAGGLTDRASKTIHIKSKGADGRDIEKTVDFKRIVSGKEQDPVIEQNDVVIVKESFF